MQNMKQRYYLIAFILFLTSAAAFAVAPQEAVDRFIRSNGINPGSVAVKITSLSDKKNMGSHNSGKALVPASIMKSVTTAALLQAAGPDYRYKTTVYTDGPLDMGILRGNLIVEGSCDPALNSGVEPFGTDILQEIAEALRKEGINRIEGMVIIDSGQFAGPARPSSWQQADFSQSYGTGSHAFNFENNCSGRRAVEKPENVFLTRLRKTLAESGVIIDGKDLGEGERRHLFTHFSPSIDEIMRSCMMRSDNLFAESMLRTYGKLNAGDGSTADAAAREYEMWRKKKMPLEGVAIIDGSGLSRSNRVTADFMTSVLQSMADNEIYASFFPLAGQDGTLKTFLAETPLEGYIAMKTGSMKGIQCYAGYMLDDNYVPTHTVVIIMNDIKGSRDKAKKAAQTMLLDIFSDGVNDDPDGSAEEDGAAHDSAASEELIINPDVEEQEVLVEE